MQYAAITLVDFDTLFREDPDAKIISGTEGIFTKNKTKEQLLSIVQDGSRDLNFIASCECGEYMGNYWGENMICPKCKTPVKTYFADSLKFRGWIAIPDFAPPVLHPRAYDVLDKAFGNINGKSVLSSIMNIDEELPPALRGIMGQGYDYFYNNFDDIMNFFLTKYLPVKLNNNRKIDDIDYTPITFSDDVKEPEDKINLKIYNIRKKIGAIKEFIDKYRKIIFIRHIPILNQALHLITSSGTMQYSDECIEHILTSQIEVSQLIYHYSKGNRSVKFMNNRLSAFYRSYINYTTSIMDIKLLGKSGFIRKYMLGSRLHCTFRAVIVPIVDDHRYDEVHLPWAVGLECMNHEIMNILTKRMNYSGPAALEKITKAKFKYDNDIAYILNDILIKECRFQRLPVLNLIRSSYK